MSNVSAKLISEKVSDSILWASCASGSIFGELTLSQELRELSMQRIHLKSRLYTFYARGEGRGFGEQKVVLFAKSVARCEPQQHQQDAGHK